MNDTRATLYARPFSLRRTNESGRHNMVSLHFMHMRRGNATSLLLVFHLTLINLTDEPLSILFLYFCSK